MAPLTYGPVFGGDHSFEGSTGKTSRRKVLYLGDKIYTGKTLPRKVLNLGDLLHWYGIPPVLIGMIQVRYVIGSGLITPENCCII